MTERRVVVTGMGAITPIGNTLEEYWTGLTTGRLGGGTITRFDHANHKTHFASEVKNFNPEDHFDKKESRRIDRFIQFSIVASREALKNSGLDLEKTDRDEFGVIIGSGIGGLDVLEEQAKVLFEKGPGRVSPLLVPRMIGNMAAGMVSITWGLRGPNTCIVTACTAGTHAIGEAMKTIQRGHATLMLAGGTEAAITPLAFAGFENMGALSRRNDSPETASRPFSATRDGFVMGEGAATLVLEELEHAKARGAHILAELKGYGLSGDAFHMTAPAPEGNGGARAMKMALRDGGLKPEDIDYINAHGTSTDLNDKLETAAIKSVFGEHARKLAVSSTKSMTGHLLGAAGAIEAVASILAIRNGIIPPTMNLHDPDPECDLDYVPNAARKADVRAAMSNSFGFGGHNGCVVFTRYTD